MYKKRGTLLAYISARRIFIYAPNKGNSTIDIKGNQGQYEAILEWPDATKEQFEAQLDTSILQNTLFKAFYQAEIGAQ